MKKKIKKSISKKNIKYQYFSKFLKDNTLNVLIKLYFIIKYFNRNN